MEQLPGNDRRSTGAVLVGYRWLVGSVFNASRYGSQTLSGFVSQGLGQESIWRQLKRQIFLGEDTFVLPMQEKITGKSDDVNFARAQRRAPALPLAEYQKRCASRDEAIVSAYASGEYSYQQLADFFVLDFTTVGRMIRTVRSKAKL
ncbi:hypothetical protein [Methylomonas koyamae]|uniref:hypothetical protein n=1 Tax=Methylomonas koyamae TaxID=702114 RepID=UPI001E3907EB|nr:hypothetical protein [Methylomonas koyamae]